MLRPRIRRLPPRPPRLRKPGIGADPESASAYIRARGQGELAAREAFPGCVVVRPGAMFGPGDALFAGLADIVRVLPVVPLIGGGRTRVQPVYMEDVAEAIARVLAGSPGQTYELAGPGICSLRERTPLPACSRTDPVRRRA